MNKADLRKLVLQKRKLLEEKEVLSSSDAVCDKFIGKYQDKALCVLAYSAIRNEIETAKILKYYDEVYLPVTEGDIISFYRYTGTLNDGKFGVGEPEKLNPLLKKPDVIIVPGVGFDRKRNRVGYGKGFYDGFLKYYHDVPKIAFAYDFQVVENIDDIYENDVKMNGIITDKEEFYE